MTEKKKKSTTPLGRYPPQGRTEESMMSKYAEAVGEEGIRTYDEDKDSRQHDIEIMRRVFSDPLREESRVAEIVRRERR